MKIIHITYHFEFTDKIEKIIDDNGINDFIRYPMMESKDSDGKHYGTQVFPGNSSVVQAIVPDNKVDTILDQLRQFRDEKRVHQHLRAIVIPIEKTL